MSGPASGESLERTVLEQIFSATDGTSSTDHSGWMGTAGTECSWFGVICNNDLTHVTGLTLPFNGLTGILPASIGDLAEMTNLGLSVNSLTGPVPNIITVTFL